MKLKYLGEYLGIAGGLTMAISRGFLGEWLFMFWALMAAAWAAIALVYHASSGARR